MSRPTCFRPKSSTGPSPLSFRLPQMSSTPSSDGPLRRRRAGSASACLRVAGREMIGSRRILTRPAMRLCRLSRGARYFGWRQPRVRAPNALRDFAVLRVLRSDGDIDTDTALDLAIMQKVLPKVHGSRRRIEPVLTALDTLAVGARPGPAATFHAPEDRPHDRVPSCESVRQLR